MLFRQKLAFFVFGCVFVVAGCGPRTSVIRYEEAALRAAWSGPQNLVQV